MNKFVYAAIAALIPFSAAAHDGMAVEDAYARSANPKSGAVFMLLENHRKTDCTLKKVTSDAAERVVLHSSASDEGVMKMTKMEDGLTIPAGGEHLFKRGSDHVMFMGLKEPWDNGKTIKISLDFGDCGTEEVEVPVDNQHEEDAAAMHDGVDEHAGHSH